MLKNFIKARLVLSAYLTLGIASWVGAGVGLYNMLNSGGGTPTSQTNSSMSPFTEGNLRAGLQQGGYQANAVSPYWQQSFQNMATLDPNGLVRAGDQAGGQYGDLSNLAKMYQQFMQQQGGQAAGAQTNLYGAGNAAFAAGQDPQNALYDRTLQRVQDQSRAASSARGIGMSPEAAGLENQATGNFNIDWQNQQLSRMLQALGGMTSAYQGAGDQGRLVGADMSGAMNFGAQAPQYSIQSGAVPLQARETGYAIPGQAADTFYGQMYGAYAQPYFTAAGMGGGGSSTTYQPYAEQGNNMNAFLTGAKGIQNQYNQPGSWLNNMFSGGGGNNQNYNAAGTFQPYYTGTGSGGDYQYG